eukprot:RCo025007
MSAEENAGVSPARFETESTLVVQLPEGVLAAKDADNSAKAAAFLSTICACPLEGTSVASSLTRQPAYRLVAADSPPTDAIGFRQNDGDMLYAAVVETAQCDIPGFSFRTKDDAFIFVGTIDSEGFIAKKYGWVVAREWYLVRHTGGNRQAPPPGALAMIASPGVAAA